MNRLVGKEARAKNSQGKKQHKNSNHGQNDSVRIKSFSETKKSQVEAEQANGGGEEYK